MAAGSTIQRHMLLLSLHGGWMAHALALMAWWFHDSSELVALMRVGPFSNLR